MRIRVVIVFVLEVFFRSLRADLGSYSGRSITSWLRNSCVDQFACQSKPLPINSALPHCKG